MRPITQALCIYRDPILEFLRAQCLEHGEFLLASGGTSDIYLDMRKATMDARIGRMIGWAMRDVLDRSKIIYDAIGGPATAAIPLVSTIVQQECDIERIKRGFYVRSETKKHGTLQTIEGNLHGGDRIVLVDDVLTSGKSVLSAAKAVRDLGFTVTDALFVVVRDQAAFATLKENGITNAHALFTIEEILN